MGLVSELVPLARTLTGMLRNVVQRIHDVAEWESSQYIGRKK